MRTYPDGTLKAFFAGRELQVKAIARPKRQPVCSPENQRDMAAIEAEERVVSCITPKQEPVCEEPESQGEAEAVRREHVTEVKAIFAEAKLQAKEPISLKQKPSCELENQREAGEMEAARRVEDVSEKANFLGLSRASVYRHARQIREKQGLLPEKKLYDPNHHHANRTSKEHEMMVVEFSLANPEMSAVEVARYFRYHHMLHFSARGIGNVWARYDMQTSKQRIEMAKRRAA